MQEDEIKRLIEHGIPDAEVKVAGDGRHFEAIVISAEFSGLSMLERHRRVHDALGESFRSEALHALSIKTYTPDQWEKLQA